MDLQSRSRPLALHPPSAGFGMIVFQRLDAAARSKCRSVLRSARFGVEKCFGCGYKSCDMRIQPDRLFTELEVPVASAPSAESEGQGQIRASAPSRARRVLSVRRRLGHWARRSLPVAAEILLLVLLAAFFRMRGLDWDDRTHQHPDERFLTSVVNDLGWPESFSQYMDESKSPLNPRNRGKTYFTYGTLPTTIVKGVARVLNWQPLYETIEPVFERWHRAKYGHELRIPWDSYDRVYLLGRFLSGLADLGTVVFLYVTALALFSDRRIARLGALFYALSVGPIQHSHFWVVDNFAVCFISASLMFLAIAQRSRRGLWAWPLAGLFFGLAMASKASIFTFAVLPALLAVLQFVRAVREAPSGTDAARRIVNLLLVCLAAAVCAALAFRIAQPDAFSQSGLLDLVNISPRWWANIQEVKGINVTGERDVPFTLQWVGKRALWYPWTQMILWGMGPALGLAAWAAWGGALWRWVRWRDWRLALPVVWVAVLFYHQGTLWVKTMRYFLPTYPALAMLAAWGLIALWEKARGGSPQARPRARSRLLRILGAEAAIAIAVAATAAWALAFTSIYHRPHSRIQASEWMVRNLRPGATVACEHWDDTLPLRVLGKDPFGSGPNGLRLREIKMGWYDPDTPRKLEEALGWLDRSDYIILASNRLYDSIRLVPGRHPMAINYYEALFCGGLGFTRVADFTSYPRLAGLEIPDQGAEEAFTVYDHPRVQVFAKTPAYDREKARRILSEGVRWDRVRHLRGIDAHRRGRGARPLSFGEERWREYREAGTWSELFRRRSWANSHPVVAWLLALAGLTVVGFPFAFAVGRGLPDRGFGLSPALGLLLVSYLAWLGASLGVFSFDRGGLWVAIGLLGFEGAVLMTALRRELVCLVRERWRILIFEGVLFLALLGLLLAVRAMNPDLWHPARGGEKPMEMAYLTAVMKSPAFPPYDPWFAQGFINYYYYGFVMAATPILLTGIVPAVAFNLAVPTFFALTGVGVFTVSLALVSHRRRRKRPRWRELRFGCWAVLFVLLMGNLVETRLFLADLAHGLPQLRHTLSSRPPEQGRAPQWARALGEWGRDKAFLERFKPYAPRYNDHWFWNASRAIAHDRGEAPPITEFPYFTFLYADLHPHMMGLPLVLLALGLSLAVIRFADSSGAMQGSIRRSRLRQVLLYGLLALALGALWPTNAWDYPPYLGMALAAVGLAVWRRDGRLRFGALAEAVLKWGLVVAGATLLFMPFRYWYGAAYTSIEAWKGSRTPWGDYLTIHGAMLFVVCSAMLADMVRGRGLNPWMRAPRVFLLRLHRPRRLRAALRHWRAIAGRGAIWWVVYLGVLALLVFGLVLLARSSGPAATGLSVALVAAGLVWRRRPDAMWQFALVGAAGALALTVFVEFLVLRGDISRMNTVFKFYLQAWVLMGLAGTAGLARVRRLRRPWPGGKAALLWRGARVMAWRLAVALLVMAGLLYPLLATPARIRDRFDESRETTLDGAAFMRTVTHRHQDKPLQLEWDRQAIEWLQDNVCGTPVVAEANTQPILYGWGNRYAMFTGLPAVVGWDWHQRQQRALEPESVSRRIRELRRFYETPRVDEATQFIERYGVEYIVVGQLERAIYSKAGLAKFDAPPEGAPWRTVYENEGVRILRTKGLEAQEP